MALLLSIPGCAFRYAGEPGKQEKFCANRASANWVSSIHVTALTAAGIVLTSSEGGAGFDVLAAMRLEVSWLDRIEGGLVAVASIIVLFLFATRENEAEDDTGNVLLKYIFMACWVTGCLILAFNSRRSREIRNRRREPSRQSRQRAGPNVRDDEAYAAAPVNIVVLPRTWSFVMTSLSFLSYTAPQAIRLARPLSEPLRGVTGGFSNLCLVGHILMYIREEYCNLIGQ